MSSGYPAVLNFETVSDVPSRRPTGSGEVRVIPSRFKLFEEAGCLSVFLPEISPGEIDGVAELREDGGVSRPTEDEEGGSGDGVGGSSKRPSQDILIF